MQLLGRVLAILFAPLASLTENLAPSLAAVAHRPPMQGDFALAAIIVSAALITVVCSFWAAGEHIRNVHLRECTRRETSRAQSAQRFRDALIAACGQPVVVLGTDLNVPLSFAGGHELLKSCLAGPDATNLATLLDMLFYNGAAFECVALTSDRRTLTVRGKTVGGRVVVYFHEERKIAGFDVDGRGVLDALPVPIWVRSKDLALRWVNRAFLDATGNASLRHALEANVAFDRSELELAAAALDDDESVEAKRYAVIAGQRRALSLRLQPLSDVGVAGAAVDVTDVAQTEIRLQAHIDGLKDTLDNFETAVAAYDADHRLVAFNRAFSKLWDLPEKWLRAQPTDAEVLDRLREDRHLPEQRDFAAWKRSQIELFQAVDGTHQMLWHLPGGKSLRILAAKNAFGGLTFRFKDVSEQLKLESSYISVLQVQKATLDTLDDGMAIIGPDGRIKVYNASFANLWRLSDIELADRPHIRQVAEFCAKRIGRDQTWEIVASGVASSEPERLNDWGKVGRADGKAISLTMKRLPDGSTLATFTDLTETMRFDAELRGRGTAAA